MGCVVRFLLCSKEFDLAQREVWPLFLASRRASLSPWDVLPDETVFACFGGFEPHQQWDLGWGFGSHCSHWLPGRLETEVKHMDG